MSGLISVMCTFMGHIGVISEKQVNRQLCCGTNQCKNCAGVWEQDLDPCVEKQKHDVTSVQNYHCFILFCKLSLHVHNLRRTRQTPW